MFNINFFLELVEEDFFYYRKYNISKFFNL